MSEAYRQALAAGDHIAAGQAIMDAVRRGDTSSVYAVARMSRAEIEAPAPDEDLRDIGSVVQVNNTFLGRYRNGRGA